jgi:thiol:disulfide interchange protein DsbD
MNGCGDEMGTPEHRVMGRFSKLPEWMASLVAAVLVCASGTPAFAAHTRVSLLLADSNAKPGDTVMAGIYLQMDKGWHTFWVNPGWSGQPTEVEWQLPPGVTAGAFQWPAPIKIPDKDFTTYVYEHEAMILVPIKLAADAKPGTITLKADLNWQECETQCVLGKGSVEAILEIGNATNPSKDADLIKQWQQKMPPSATSVHPRATIEQVSSSDLRPLILEWDSTAAAADADFYPYTSEKYEVQAFTERLQADTGKIKLRAQVKKLDKGAWPDQVEGLLIQKSGSETTAYEAKLKVTAETESAASNQEAAVAGGHPAATTSFWAALAAAFLGGLILNVMPCVLPVIALKILGFVSQAKEDPRKVRSLGLIYGLGVVLSFLVLAGLVLGVKAAGHQAGWGMQFGNPHFLIALCVLVTLVAASLFGVFEVNLSGQLMGAAGTQASKHGAAGAFFNGVLATVLATPCTAPILSFALGFAFAQPAATLVLLLVTVGVGLAFPYVLLSWHPAWLKFLPKPGRWMERFKVAMGFPMLATAFWLLSLMPTHYGARAWWVGILMVFVGLAAWMFGEFGQRASQRRALGSILSLAVLILGFVVVGGQLNKSDVIKWEKWSPEAVAKARADGKAILVDFGATWCATCNTLVKPAIEHPDVARALDRIHAIAMYADYSKAPPEITAELNRFNSPGVPLVLVYPKDASKGPIVLPQPTSLPASYRTVILDALKRAG